MSLRLGLTQAFILFLAALWASAPNAVRAEAPDAAFVEGLRQRKWFDLAQDHCQLRLAQVEQTSRQCAELTAESIRTSWTQAVQASPPERQQLWMQARSTGEEFFKRSPAHPLAAAVRLQQALALVAQGELARLESETRPLTSDRLEQAQQTLREAADLLESLARELQRELPLRRRRAGRTGEFTVDQLVDLAAQTQYHLARSQKNRAALYPAGSDDRVAQLVATAETLERLLAGLRPGQPLMPLAQLDLAECHRLLGRHDQAQALAADIDRESQSPVKRLRARGEQIRIALAQNDMPALTELVTADRTVDAQTSPELDFARFEAFLALAKNATDAKQVGRFQQQAAEAAALLQDEHGSAWAGRVDELLASAPAGAMPLANVQLLVRTAESHFLQGDFDRAVLAYDQAAQTSQQAKAAAAFNLAYKAALVEQHRGNNGAAAARLRKLAHETPSHEKAAAAHLLAIWNASRALRQDDALAAMYDEMLAEHLSAWPQAESAEQVRLWLGARQRENGHVQEAIKTLSAISRNSPHAQAAASELVQAWKQRLAALADAGEPIRDEAVVAIRSLRESILDENNRWPAAWSEAERSRAIAAAELIVEHQPGSASDAEDLLRRALAGSPDARPEWRAAAQAQLVVALAAQGGRHQDAVAALREMGAASPEQMLAVIAALARVTQRGSELSRTRIAGVALAAVESLSPVRDHLAQSQKLALDRAAAEALLAAGRRQEAVKAYAKLAEAHPDSGQTQEAYAAMLLASDDAADLQQALGQWRVVASRSRLRSERWCRAKYSVAVAHYKLGNKQEALALLKFVMGTPPGLPDSKWEQTFLELMKKYGE